MMERYVTYLPDGTLDGCYLQEPPLEHQGRMIIVSESLAVTWLAYRANAARDGVELIPVTPNVPTEAETLALYEASIDQHLDSTAWLYGYDSILSAVTYADEPAVAAFQVEGQALRRWRSLVWQKCRDVLADYRAGQRPAPTASELIAELPDLDLPPPTLGRVAPTQQ